MNKAIILAVILIVGALFLGGCISSDNELTEGKGGEQITGLATGPSAPEPKPLNTGHERICY